MIEFFKNLGVDMEVSDMSFSVSLDSGRGCEWGCRSLSSLFAQKRNIFSPYFWKMITEIKKFKEDVLKYLEDQERNLDMDRTKTLGGFLKSRGYSDLFQKAYLVPVCSLIWSCPAYSVLNFSAYSVLSFCRNHHLLQIFGRPQWLTVAGRSQTYVAKVRAELEQRGCKIRTSCKVESVATSEDGCVIATTEEGSQEVYDKCILAVHAPDAGSRDLYLHGDTDLMPRNTSAWSAWNFLGDSENKASLTYWLNIIQNLGEERDPFFLTINPEHTPKETFFKWTTGHPLPSVSTWKASLELHNIQGKRGIWFCGAYQGYGFHEDGLKALLSYIINTAGMAAAQGLLGKQMVTPLSNPKHMVPSLTEKGARILEEGGSVYTFAGKNSRCHLKSVLVIHSPQFYWKVMTQADLGLADAYINGDFSFVDKERGLLDLLMILIANKELNSNNSNHAKRREWWTPMFLTASLASAKHFLKHVSRQNTLTQARRNISRHYDLSNELFALFLDDTMTYSSAVFKVTLFFAPALAPAAPSVAAQQDPGVMPVHLLFQQPGREHLPFLQPNPRRGYSTWFTKSKNGISRSINQMMYSMLRFGYPKWSVIPSDERELWFRQFAHSDLTETVRKKFNEKAMDSYTKQINSWKIVWQKNKKPRFINGTVWEQMIAHGSRKKLQRRLLETPRTRRAIVAGKSNDEDLRTAQMRKISLLIDKSGKFQARIEKNHEVLEIGCGWGTLAIEVVRSGCKYTGVTLSIEQFKYAEQKVKEAGLEDRIKFELYDYRQLSDAHKYDRIISCEMLEAVGHEFMETFFTHCEAALAEDGIFVLQFISIPEERYDEYRLSSDFIKEYIFPGGCLPSLGRVTSAMASSSRL
uniref:Amine oxidase domain-containing protein n=1 Tax=Brassica oleracea var. oleracea TaxID=109376 RepID=A0A0D3AB72_BRAOL